MPGAGSNSNPPPPSSFIKNDAAKKGTSLIGLVFQMVLMGVGIIVGYAFFAKAPIDPIAYSLGEVRGNTADILSSVTLRTFIHLGRLRQI